MKAIIGKSKISGKINVPASKSIAHRSLICAALSKGETVIENFPVNEDTSATADCLSSFGIVPEINSGTAVINGGGGGFTEQERTLPCRESGSTLRFMIPPALTDGVTTHFTGAERLFERPLSVYEKICSDSGILFQRSANGITVGGRLKAGTYEVPGNISSQFITGLMFALPLLDGESRIVTTTPLESASYIALTLEAMEAFGFTIEDTGNAYVIPGGQTGLSPGRITVPGDESGAAFFGALNMLGGTAELCGLDAETKQGDRVWRDHFEMLGKGKVTLSIADCPDLAPILIVAAALGHGAVLTDTARLRFKESDRGAVMACELAKCGVEITAGDNEIIIPGGQIHAPAKEFESHNDHRIAMSLAVLSTVTGGTINGAESVKKSMPEFWDILINAGADIKLI